MKRARDSTATETSDNQEQAVPEQKQDGDLNAEQPDLKKSKTEDSPAASTAPLSTSTPTTTQGDATATTTAQKPKRTPKKKVAMLIGYRGTGYSGLQRNPGVKSIEEDLEKAIVEAGGIESWNAGSFKKVDWQRCARTDKGVHALGNVVSFKFCGDESTIDRINELLPAQIRVFDAKKVTKSFNAKGSADSRVYEYILPVYALDPDVPITRIGEGPYRRSDHEEQEEEEEEEEEGGGGNKRRGRGRVGNQGGKGKEKETTEDSTTDGAQQAQQPQQAQQQKPEEKATYIVGDSSFKVTEEVLKTLNDYLSMYLGTHNFFNFTSRVEKNAPSNKRYILSFKCDGPVTLEGVDFVRFEVHGQSFMLHQIRKMIGLVVELFRKKIPKEFIRATFNKKLNIPMAPGEGLMLQKCLFESYSKGRGKDNPPITWDNVKDKVHEFRMKEVYPCVAKCVAEDFVFARWIDELNHHEWKDFGGLLKEAGLQPPAEETPAAKED